MTARILALALVAGCVTGHPTTSKDTDPTGDTATVVGASCPQASPIRYQACLETTATPATTSGTPYYAPTVVEGSGTVTEVGGFLAGVTGSAAIQGFQACGGAFDHEVRLVDTDGETWTFGWILAPVGDASTDAIEAGDAVDFYAIWEFLGYSSAGAMLLSDATGPLFLLELETELDDAQRGGVTVQLNQDSCVSDEDGREYYQVEFGWSAGAVDLWPGEVALVPLPARTVSVALGDSSWLTGCADGCGEDWWAAWAEK